MTCITGSSSRLRKPGSVRCFVALAAWRSFLWDARYRTPRAAYPEARAGRPRTPLYVALLRMGFAVPKPLPASRWALTPPFHPYLQRCRSIQAVSFSVALSSRFPSPGVTRHPALRSPDFPLEPGPERAPEALERWNHSRGSQANPEQAAATRPLRRVHVSARPSVARAPRVGSRSDKATPPKRSTRTRRRAPAAHARGVQSACSVWGQAALRSSATPAASEI